MAYRSWVKLDRYALFDLSRELHLKTADLVILYSLVMLADFRNWEWIGTIVELTEHTPLSRTTAATACDRLAKLGAISFVNPFRQHAAATIRVDCYGRLVLPNARKGANQEAGGQPMPLGKRLQNLNDSSSNQSGIATPDANHLGQCQSGGRRGGGDEGSSWALQQEGYVCPDCGKPEQGAPFGDNCACPF
jgi:hypothetical protein